MKTEIFIGTINQTSCLEKIVWLIGLLVHLVFGSVFGFGFFHTPSTHLIREIDAPTSQIPMETWLPLKAAIGDKSTSRETRRMGQ